MQETATVLTVLSVDVASLGNCYNAGTCLQQELRLQVEIAVHGGGHIYVKVRKAAWPHRISCGESGASDPDSGSLGLSSAIFTRHGFPLCLT